MYFIPQTPDILHPLSRLEWEERPSLPVEMYDAHAVFLEGTLHVGGGSTLGSYRDNARLYSCKPGGVGSWTATDTPTYHYALTTYDSHLLLVGGREYPSHQITNKIYTMIDGEFKELLPPMKKKRHSTSAVSSGSVLAVAGGYDGSRRLSSVEVYNNGQWTSGQSLPDACWNMKSVFHGDKWILIGRTKVYCVSPFSPLYQEQNKHHGRHYQMSHLNIQLLLSLVVVFYLLEEGTILTPHHPSMPTHQTPNPGYMLGTYLHHSVKHVVLLQMES